MCMQPAPAGGELRSARAEASRRARALILLDRRLAAGARLGVLRRPQLRQLLVAGPRLLARVALRALPLLPLLARAHWVRLVAAREAEDVAVAAVCDDTPAWTASAPRGPVHGRDTQ